MSVTTRYPLDYDTLDKGDVIPKEKLAEIFGIHWKYADFNLKAMELGKTIIRELENRNKFVLTKMQNNNLMIMHDEDAYLTQKRRFKAKFRGMRRDHQNALTIDSSKFSEDLKQAHTNTLTKQAAMLIGAMAGVGKTLPEGSVYQGNTPPSFKPANPKALPTPTAHTRNTPRAFEKKKPDETKYRRTDSGEQTKPA